MDINKTLKYINEQLMKKGADDVIASASKTTSSQIKFSDNTINTTKTWDSIDLGVFLSYKKRIVSTNFKEFDKKAIDNGIKLLMKFAKSALPNESFNGIANGKFKYSKVKGIYDKKHGDRVDFEVKVMNEYYDDLPFTRFYNQALLQRIAAV